MTLNYLTAKLRPYRQQSTTAATLKMVGLGRGVLLASWLFYFIFSVGLFAQPLPDISKFSLPEQSTVMTPKSGLFIVDYQDIRLPDHDEIDLIGYHILSPVNQWAAFGIGGYAPFLKGEYGGFMAFGVLAHAQTPLADKLFATAGLSFGGGGGGRSVSGSVALSGTGGFAKAYMGLGYDFGPFALGATLSHFEFFKSKINNTQLAFFLQKPFQYALGPYGQAGAHFTRLSGNTTKGHGSMVGFGLDNYFQINPQAAYKGTINAADLQYSKFYSTHAYWYYALGVGYKGLPIYNQAVVGLGARFALSDRVNLYGQLGLGTGGYAPSLIDTGSGLLAYPKLSVEFLVRPSWGLSLTAGYVLALDGTARNLTFGLGLNRHFNARTRESGTFSSQGGRFEGYHFSISNETALNLSFDGQPLASLNMISIQLDKNLSQSLYLPIRASISYQSYRGYPGYGEVSAGLGLQSRYAPEKPMQIFAEFHLGANVQGGIAKGVLGLAYSLREGLALRATMGQTLGQSHFRATNFSFGITSRFSLPVY